MVADYSMCCQTVTVYRQNGPEILRQVIPGCFLQWEVETGQDENGSWQERNFLLIQPGQEQLVFPGDTVFEGIGPELNIEDWEPFLSSALSSLGEVNYASVYHWEGKFCHTEAGRN